MTTIEIKGEAYSRSSTTTASKEGDIIAWICTRDFTVVFESWRYCV